MTISELDFQTLRKRCSFFNIKDKKANNDKKGSFTVYVSKTIPLTGNLSFRQDNPISFLLQITPTVQTLYHLNIKNIMNSYKNKIAILT